MKDSFSRMYDKLAGVLDEILEEGERTGVFKNVPKHTLSRLYVSFVEGTGLNWLMSKGGFDLDEQFTIMIERMRDLIMKRKQ